MDRLRRPISIFTLTERKFLYNSSDDGSGALNSDAAQNLLIGDGPGGALTDFDGEMDDVRYYDRVLSPSEISDLYNGIGGGACSSPSGVEGQMVYNTSFNVMQYCNGADWVGIGK